MMELKIFKFTPQNLKRAEEIINKYPKEKQASAVMPLLDLAQRQHDNWLPPEAIEYVAEILAMPAIRAYEVATFYTMYNLSPIGNYHIQICTNLPCWLRGSDTIVKTCKQKLEIEFGETTPDGIFTLSEVECLGACVNAPIIQINDDYFEDLDSKSVETILDAYQRGEKVKTGSQKKRYTCEPIGGLTSLVHQANAREKMLKDV